jgi:hypothetical protein
MTYSRSPEYPRLQTRSGTQGADCGNHWFGDARAVVDEHPALEFLRHSGEPLDRIRAGNTERMVAGIPQSREFRTGQAFAGKHRDRQVGVAKQLFSAMGSSATTRTSARTGCCAASVNSTRRSA